MTRQEMVESMQELGMNYEMLSMQIGMEAGRLEAALLERTTELDYNALIALNKYFESMDSRPECVSENLAYQIEKEQGDYTIDDFYALSDDIRVELIDGVFYYHPTAPMPVHQMIAFEVGRQIMDYIEKKKGGCMVFLSPVCVQLDYDDKTMVQPDVLILCDKNQMDEKYIQGAPDWIMEVLSPSTQNNDLFLKKKKYEAAGVKEYWIVDPKKKLVTIYDFGKSDFTRNYSFEDLIPVSIYQNDLQIDMRRMGNYQDWIK